MLDFEAIRAHAMTFPGVEQGPPVPAARRMASFKVGGKSFLGIEKGEQSMTVSLSVEEARAYQSDQPDAYEEIWRTGHVFAGLRVNLSRVSEARARDLIESSWRHTAPHGLLADYDAQTHDAE